MIWFAMASIYGDGYAFGGDTYNGVSSKIYKLSCKLGFCHWTTLNKELKAARYWHVVIPVNIECDTDCGDSGLMMTANGQGCTDKCDIGQLVSSDGTKCVTECLKAEYVSLAGDQCLITCPDDSSPNFSNPSQCQCHQDLVPSTNGEQCVQPGKHDFS